MSDVTTIPVGDDYEVLVGHGVSARVAEVLPEGVARVLVVHGAPLTRLAEPVTTALRDAGLEVHVAPVPDAEAAKTVEVAAGLWAVMGQAGFTRTDAVVAVGGGSVTDLAGWAAAAWLRGVAVVHVPTTVLGMVDAAVGGKTGINTAEGKNLVGAFHTPAAVLCDLDHLATLPPADLSAGLAEVVKGGFIADPRILEVVEADESSVQDPGSTALREVIERKIAIKARVVAADLRESNLREILNYGHTLGHAIEHHEGYRMRHGEAVAIGMVYAAELAHRTGHIDAALLERHRYVLGVLGLPTSYSGASFDELLTALRRDKKTRGATLRFVVLDALAEPTRLVGPDESLLREAYAALA
ncbi:3-dehydroquinate synthase [Janibacter indicus]|uniref:3-dehydroquinate synthase n=1 Tax=Janibacter indicus TaxID=857417 RepID=A0A1L3MGY6_9MICO|nr:3-dehydroquinate synthase [Janibacter indicus]APH01619.1 3-dehydroquinate synthase [Janibacter indicus]QOK21531.1 3-dehydroquinate synthase [Janibacter indicus]